MAEVFLAEHVTEGQTVAIKVMHKHLGDGDNFIQRFAREARILKTVTHPHILKVFDYHVADIAPDISYIVMEFINGRSLDERVSQLYEETRSAALPQDEALRIIAEVGQALVYAHNNGLLHRDIKPSNVMETIDGRIILTDFGLAKSISDSRLTATGMMMGTPAYMPPENALGMPGDHRADIYSLGVMLFELVVGQLPFKSDTVIGLIMQHVSMPPPLPSQLKANIPLWLDDAILKTLAKRPEERYNSVAELLSDLGLTQHTHTVAGPTFSDTLLEHDTVVGQSHHEAMEQMRDEIRRQLEGGASLISTLSPKLAPPFQAPPLSPHYIDRQITEQIKALLLQDTPATHIIGLHGLAAVGKSVLSTQLAYELQESFPDGILWAKLDNQSLEAQLISIAAAFGQAEAINKIPDLSAKEDFVRQLLLDKHVLYILDQVDNSRQIRSLLPNGAKNVTLITTRNRKLLQDTGAVAIPVLPFTFEQTVAYLRRILGNARVEAEQEEARRLHEFTGGLPLALSIVAGYLQESDELTIAEYNGILHDEQTRLENLADWEDETRDVAASFELSYQSLPNDVQSIFLALSVFDGPDFDSQAITAVTQLSAARVKIALGRLQTLSLVNLIEAQRETLVGAQTINAARYSINSLLKLFARQKLGDKEAVYRQQAAEYFVSLAEEYAQSQNYNQLDFEWQNIVGALDWAYENKQYDLLTRGILPLTQNYLGIMGFMEARGHWPEARQLLSQAAEGLDQLADPLQKATILVNLGGFAVKQSDFVAAQTWLNQALSELDTMPQTDEVRKLLAYACDFMGQRMLAIDREEALDWVWRGWRILQKGDLQIMQPQLGYLYMQIANIQARMGQFEDAIRSAQLGLSALPLEPSAARISGFTTLGMIHYLQGDNEASSDYLNQALLIARQLGDAHKLATIWLNIGANEKSRGRLQNAAKNYARAINLYQHMGNAYFETGTRINIGQIHAILGEDTAAREQFDRAIALSNLHNLLDLKAMAQSNLADLEIVNGRYQTAEQLLIEALTAAEEVKAAHLIPTLHRAKAEAALGQQQADQALLYIDEALQKVQETKDQEEEGISWRVKGEILVQLQKNESATAAFEQSLELLADQNPYQLALSQLAWATSQPQHPRARELRELAKAGFTEIGAVRELNQLN
ncbi:MAG: protein kinase [Anaerolineales bacterium]|nr:protein kinase [Anaerolineales bacterium]